MIVITHRRCVEKYKDIKGKVLEPFLSDLEARCLLKNITPTSIKYIKMKKKQAEKEHGRKLDPTEYRVFRDSVLAEVCAIELSDPQIRIVHKMEPAV